MTELKATEGRPPDYWDTIGQDDDLMRARRTLSINEIQRIARHVTEWNAARIERMVKPPDAPPTDPWVIGFCRARKNSVELLLCGEPHIDLDAAFKLAQIKAASFPVTVDLGDGTTFVDTGMTLREYAAIEIYKIILGAALSKTGLSVADTVGAMESGLLERAAIDRSNRVGPSCTGEFSNLCGYS